MIAAHETNRDIAGLAHLVEAATALTELVDSKQSPAVSAKACAPSKPAQRSVVSDDDDDRREKHALKAKKREIFPQRLMDILSDRSLSDVISWLPHGRSFVIIRPDIFTEQVLPKYLPPVDARTSTKYPSFTRKLNRWGFRQATRGPDTGAFHHPLFRRDQPDLCLQMACQKSRDRKEQTRRSTLPPKKRSVSDSSKKPAGESANVRQRGPQFATPESRTNASAPNVSADDRSVASAGNSSTVSTTTSDAGVDQLPASIGSASSKEETTILPFISNDPAFVAEALRQRDAEEVVRAAKAMLYEAYVKAVRAD